MAMASVASLGIHKPSAIPFLVEEGILPVDPSEDVYSWETGTNVNSGSGVHEEELLTTKHCVVWSRGGTIRRVFRFDVEGEDVTRALFATFPAQPRDIDSTAKTSHVVEGEGDKSQPELLEPRKHHKLRSRSLQKEHGKKTSESVSHQGKDSFSRHALVIVLKTQAHIFILSEKSHIVHLPFEVDAVYSLPRGILLQRKISGNDVPVPTPRIPSAPENTFAFSKSSVSRLSDHNAAHLTGSNDSASPLAPLLKDLLQTSRRRSVAPRLRLFCLLDPLSEIGAVVTKKTTKLQASYMPRASSVSLFDGLDPNERVIYMSPEDELGQSMSISKVPLILAVTENRESGRTSLWTVSYLDRPASMTAKAQPSGSTSATFSRRQSSFGIGTGATTPSARGNGPGRESVGGSLSRYQRGNHATLDKISLENNDDGLLDPAFGDPAAPGKSSRRVSSLLARADLAANNDRTTFSEHAGGHGKRSSRKSASFGPHISRLSNGVDNGARFTASQPLSDIRSSMGSVDHSEAQFKDIIDDIDDMRELKGQDDPNPLGSNGNMRKEIMFHKIHSTHTGASNHPRLGGHAILQVPDVFTIGVPDSNLRSPRKLAGITMCIVDKAARGLLLFHIDATKVQSPQSSKYDFRVAESRQSGILGACKVGDGVYQRILTLSENLDGKQGLSLQAPWSSSHRINLPSPLNIHNPYQINNDVDRRQRREGGFRRILSQGPQAFSTLQRGDLRGRVDVVDTAGLRHGLDITLQPHHFVVHRVVKVCEAILPTSPSRREPILQAWWDVMCWLEARSEEETDLEWTAMMVVLFSMATPFIKDKRVEAVKQEKRRKGGLLRSSSGANTDLESWETMLHHEHDFTSTTPSWMAQGAWKWTGSEETPTQPSLAKKPRSSSSHLPSAVVPIAKKSSHLLHCISLAQDFTRSPAGQTASGTQGYLPTALSWDTETRRTVLASILIALHLLREELKLDVLAVEALHKLTPVLAQIGGWLGWQNWGCRDGSYYMSESTDMENWLFDDSVISGLSIPIEPFQPPSIFRFIESINSEEEIPTFVSLLDVASPAETELRDQEFAQTSEKKLVQLTPRTALVTSLLAACKAENTEAKIAKMTSWGLTLSTLESLPESVAVSFRTALVACQARPSTAWNNETLELIGREDLAMLQREKQSPSSHGRSQIAQSNDALRDVHSVCNIAFEVEALGPYDGSAEIDRQSVTRLLFKEDQRFAEAAKLVHPLLYPMAACVAEPEWSDIDLLEAQQELAKIIAMRTLSVSLGRGLIFYSARLPLLTEKFPIHGFTLSCVIKPGDNTVTADRSVYSEEKVSWAFFHAGVEAGLSISKEAKGVDTSWVLFNKPRDLNNRHAGFLLAMGLNGHLKSIAKWVAFKYLTPKHSMTSVGLLLGLSASHLGTMDTLIIRLLSVHVTRMLPPGAAELNLSPLTQTSGIMGIGLLYCNTQHRRMSEIMLSEMENVDEEDSSNPLDGLRDEGYRLAAGFAMGYINLGRGKDLKGLHDMHIIERLLAIAIAAKKADRVHVIDRATAGATIAIALIFMKSHDGPLARKIDIPDTVHQFEYVRPDHFLLRTVAKHLIMWNDVQATFDWIKEQLPQAFQKHFNLTTIRTLTSEDLPFLNMVTGLCFSIGLHYAGSGLAPVRDLLCHYLNHLMRICRLPTLNYDGKLARITVRNCQDLVALSAACVMAGTGDIQVFRHLRSLHGRTDLETPYGSHLAAHFAIGVLFLGGGSHTFGTSNIAVASLLCAFYPLFPCTVLDNKSHLQAFRHFWVLATERRCLVARDVDTQRPISLPILVTTKDGDETALTAPCLLPELHTIAKVETNDTEYWRVTLDLINNPQHLEAFKRHQSIYVRRRAAYDAHSSVFSATMQALNDAQLAHQSGKQALDWVFTLPAFAGFDRAAQAVVLPSDPGGAIFKGTRGTVLDDRLVLEKACEGSGKSERLWNLRVFLAWAEGVEGREDGWGWIGKEVVEGLRATLAMRRRQNKAR